MHPRTLAVPIAALLLASACSSEPSAPTAAPSAETASESPSPEASSAPPASPEPGPPPETQTEATAEPEPSSAPPPSAPAETAVTIADFDFAPDPIEVAVGGTVTWTNQDSTAHTASVSGGGPDTGAIRGGEAGTLTFDEPGTFDYVCAFHPGSMTGTIVVR